MLLALHSNKLVNNAYLLPTDPKKQPFLGMSLFMIYLVIRTSMQSDMFHLSPAVLNEPWFKTTLVDFYFNITIISAWVIYKENNWARSILWIAAFVLLGSIATAFYVFLQLNQLAQGRGVEDILIHTKVQNTRESLCRTQGN